MDNAQSTGIHFRRYGGTVPPYEEHATRLRWHFTLEEWSRMPVEERALAVVVRRVERAIENIQNDAEVTRMKKKQSRGFRK